MFFWFIGTAIVAIAVIFRDPNFDNRLLIVGSVVPILDGLFGGARALHSITVSIALLAAVMIGTRRGSGRRRTLLGLPIGMLMHLVFDAAWNDTDTFWWPFTGWSFSDAGNPIVERGAISLVLEAIGVAICVWLWRSNGLASRDRRQEFLRDGRLAAIPARMA